MAIIGLPASEQQQSEFFDRVLDGFALASSRAGEVVRDFRVAGTFVRLRFAGEALLPIILPGLANPLPAQTGEPDHEIRIWDSESTGVPLAPPPRSWEDFTGRGNIWGFDSLRYRSAYLWGEGSVNLMDRKLRRAIFWVPSHQFLPAWVMAAPLRHILHWCMELSGRQLVHGAAVGHNGQAVLIPGRSGSGKSSTSLACLAAGLEFVADDYLAIALDPEPRVYRLYTTAKLYPSSLALHPCLKERCRNVYVPEFDKVVLFLEDGYKDQLRESLPLRLVLRPYISGQEETTIVPTESIQIERALAAETLVQLPHVGAQTVAFLERISREVPHAEIVLGTERSRIPGIIQAAIEATPRIAPVPVSTPKPRPFVSLIVHFRDHDLGELRQLAANIAEQNYPRVELLVASDGAAVAMEDEIAKLPGSVRFLPFTEQVVSAVAWNRAVREAFAELLVLLEPGDRLTPDGLGALVDAYEADPGSAWVQGKIQYAENGQPSGPLRGAMLRKSAFRDHGLFNTGPFALGREHQEWVDRLTAAKIPGRRIDTCTLHAGRTVPGPDIPLKRRLFMRVQDAKLGRRGERGE